eukprot:5462957-Pyramimonas_sp.AAC.1
MVFSPLRGAGLAKTERNQVLIQTGCDYSVTEAKMASRSNLVEHINLAIDIKTSGRPGWGALDAACGFNMMGLGTYA